jgi:hypothetical protein
MNKLPSHFALTPLNGNRLICFFFLVIIQSFGNGKPSTGMLLHVRISQHVLIDVDKIGMTTPNSKSYEIISISVSPHVSHVT